MRQRLTLATCLFVLGVVAQATAGTFSESSFTGDGDIGISAGNTYTHALDFNNPGPAISINGVPFAIAGTSGANFATTGLPATFTGAATTATGDSSTLLANFLHNGNTGGNESVTFYGLTAGATYSTRFYTSPFGVAGARLQTVTSGTDSTVYDGNGSGPRYLDYTFQATGASNTISFDAAVDANSFHQYGLTNQFVAAPSTLAGTTTAISGLFNTGVDNTGMPLGDGAIDPHYTILSGAHGTGPNAIVEDSTAFPIVAGPWLPNSNESKWIGPALDTVASPGGIYEYELTFDLTDLIPETAVITGDWASDNGGLDILINGVSTGNTNGGFGAFSSFLIDDGFLPGINSLVFQLSNDADGYTGLRVENIQGTAVVAPEPASIAIWIVLGLAGIGFGFWRGRSRSS